MKKLLAMLTIAAVPVIGFAGVAHADEDNGPPATNGGTVTFTTTDLSHVVCNPSDPEECHDDRTPAAPPNAGAVTFTTTDLSGVSCDPTDPELCHRAAPADAERSAATPAATPVPAALPAATPDPEVSAATPAPVGHSTVKRHVTTTHAAPAPQATLIFVELPPFVQL